MKIVAVFLHFTGANGTFCCYPWSARHRTMCVSLMAGRSHVFQGAAKTDSRSFCVQAVLTTRPIDWLKPPVDSVVNYEMTRYRQLRPGSVAQWLVVLWEAASKPPVIAQHWCITSDPHGAQHLYHLHQAQPLGDGVHTGCIVHRWLKRNSGLARQNRHSIRAFARRMCTGISAIREVHPEAPIV